MKKCMLLFAFTILSVNILQTNPHYGEMMGRYKGALQGAALAATPAAGFACLGIAYLTIHPKSDTWKTKLQAAGFFAASATLLATGAYLGSEAGGLGGQYIDRISNN